MTDYKKVTRKSRDPKVKTQGVRLARTTVTQGAPITKDSKVVGKAIFFDNGDIESVDYKFTWNGNIFYPKGFEKEILLNFGAKRLTNAEIDEIMKDQGFKGVRIDVSERQDFLENLRSGNTLQESWLDDNLVFGELVIPPDDELETDEDVDDQKIYFYLSDNDGEKLFDVTNLKGESVMGTGEPLSQINDFLFPQIDFLFKVNGREFAVDYTGQKDFEIGTGFGDPSDEDLQKVRTLLDEKVHEEREKFTRKHGASSGRKVSK